MNACSIIRGLFVLAVAAACPATAQAQLFRAYLAIDGNDANPCTLPQPCRLLPAALAAVADGGEIWMLDSANYNTATVTIGKSVSILAVPGVVGSVVATGGPALYIGASGLEVALRNLVIVPLPGGGATWGIRMAGNSSLTIENSVLANLPASAVATSAGSLRVANSVIRGSGGWAAWIESGARGEFSGTRMTDNHGGVVAYNSAAGTSLVSVVDCVISGGMYGVWTNNYTTGARLTVARSVIEGTTYALKASTPDGGVSVVTVSGSTITGNEYAWHREGVGSLIRTLGDNQFTGNTTSLGALTPVSPQ